MRKVVYQSTELTLDDSDLKKTDRNISLENISLENLNRKAYKEILNASIVTFTRDNKTKILKNRYGQIR